MAVGMQGVQTGFFILKPAKALLNTHHSNLLTMCLMFVKLNQFRYYQYRFNSAPAGMQLLQ
jgi:hypothetical protein